MFLYSITCGNGKDKEGKPIDNVSGRLGIVRAHLAKVFGGFSEYAVTGGYRMASGEYVEEPAVRWDIVADDAAALEIRKWAGMIRDLFHQESVLSTKKVLENAEFI